MEHDRKNEKSMERNSEVEQNVCANSILQRESGDRDGHTELDGVDDEEEGYRGEEGQGEGDQRRGISE